MGQCRENIFHEEREVYAVEKNVVAMLLQPGKEAELISIKPSFQKIEELVGGLADITWPINERFCIAVNDTGKLDGLPLNRALRDKGGRIVDIYAGDIVILGCGKRGGFVDLEEDEIGKLFKRFGKPEFGWKTEEFLEKDAGKSGSAGVVIGKVDSFEDLIKLLKDVYEK